MLWEAPTQVPAGIGKRPYNTCVAGCILRVNEQDTYEGGRETAEC